METAQELLLRLQNGQSSAVSAPATVVVQQTTGVPASQCNPSGPTNASVVDQQKMGGQENCEVEFTIANPDVEGAVARVTRIGGDRWYPAVAGATNSKATDMSIPNNGFEGSAAVVTDFGFGDVTFGGSLNDFNGKTSDGVLVNGMCIDFGDTPRQKVTLFRVDGQGNKCSKRVIEPVCSTCITDENSNTFCYEFCRVLGKYNWIEIGLPVGAAQNIKLSTAAYATANPLVAC